MKWKAIIVFAVPDPDLEMGGGGGVVSKKIFSALWTSVWSKNKGGVRPPWAPPLDRPLLCIILVPKLRIVM